MANKTNEMEEINSITVTYDGESYALDFDKASIKALAPKVSKLQEEGDPFKLMYTMFKSALKTKNPMIKNSLIDDMWEDLSDKGGFMEVLVALHEKRSAEILNNDSGKASWSTVA